MKKERGKGVRPTLGWRPGNGGWRNQINEPSQLASGPGRGSRTIPHTAALKHLSASLPEQFAPSMRGKPRATPPPRLDSAPQRDSAKHGHLTDLHFFELRLHRSERGYSSRRRGEAPPKGQQRAIRARGTAGAEAQQGKKQDVLHHGVGGDVGGVRGEVWEMCGDKNFKMV